MFSFLTPTDKFAFTWRGFYRDQKETIAGSVQVADCLPTLPIGISGGQNAALDLGRFAGTPAEDCLSCEDSRIPGNSRFEEFGWSKHTKWEGVPICCERLCNDLWLLGISSALALLAQWSIWWWHSGWEKMAAFPPPPLPPSLQASALSSSGVSALGTLCSSLTCECRWFL